ncbi:uncharacterized protein LOC132062048 [Lycium ferocissimum]|uniref:uncharacterized protein LOC132062048 n=1 Tax=Lycium ferocissimum TaxID=112874 RepID=UPI002815C72B|nr:uncharacterized protein LOC132062048 [Lycium ferocissimum]
MDNAYTRADFDRLMEDMDNIDNRVRGYLFDVGYEKWYIAHSTVNRSMVMTSNIAKSLNSATRHARDLPIKSLLQFMMDLVMRWNNDNQKDATATFTELGNKYNIIMKENIILSDKMTVMTSTHYVYLVMDGEKRNIVCMHEKKCSCQRFQIDGIPCPHAMAVLSYTYMEVQNYCAAYYTREYFLKAYEMPVNPLPDESAWDIPTEVLDQIVKPPTWIRRPSRPRVKRYKGIFEYLATSNPISCGRCGQKGHNRRTCKNASTRI